ASVLLWRRQQEMHVIGHEAIGVQRASTLFRQLLQYGQIDEVIRLVPKTRLPVVTALYDVQRHVVDHQASLSRHTGTTGHAAWRLTRSGCVPEPDRALSPNSESGDGAGNARIGRFPDLRKALAHGERVDLVADAHRAA